MRRAIVLLLLAASGCLNLDELGRLNDLSVAANDGDGDGGDMGVGDGGAPRTFAWVPASTNLPPSQALAVIVDPTTTSNVYASLTIGGVYRSTDGGGSWSKASTGLPTAAPVNTLAIDPTSPTTLYAGTSANGVYKSTDGASSWAPANVGFTSSDIYAIALDAAAPATVFAAEGSGILKSVDGGAHWATSNTGLPVGAVRDLAIAHSLPNTMLATEYAGQGVYESVDYGAHWKALNSGLGDLHAYAVAIDPRSAANFFVSTTSGLYHCTDGTSWTATKLTQAVQAIVFDPSASSTIYAVSYGNGIYRSLDGGTTWTITSTGQNTPLAFDVTVDPSASPTLYAATLGVVKSEHRGDSWEAGGPGLTDTIIDTLVADPTAASTVYAGTPYLGQVMRSTSATVSWSFINPNLQNAGAITAIAVDPTTPTNLYVGTQSAGLVKSTSRGSSWVAMNSGLAAGVVSAVAVDPHTPANVYVGVTGAGLYRSTNGALDFTMVDTGLGTVRAIVVDQDSGAVVVAGDGGFDAGSGGGIARSADGVTYQSAGAGLTTSRIEALVSDGLGHLFAGANGGGVFRSDDGALSWAAVNSGITNTAITSLAVDPYAPAVLYAGALGAGVYQSRNSGQSWLRLATGLTNLNVVSLTVTTGGVVLAGTDGDGVFVGSGQ